MVGKNKSGAGPGFKPQLSHMENGMRRFILVACLLLRKGAWPFPRGMGCSPLVCAKEAIGAGQVETPAVGVLAAGSGVEWTNQRLRSWTEWESEKQVWRCRKSRGRQTALILF